MLFNLFKKSPKSDDKPSTYLTLRVREVVRETPDAVTIYFEHPEPHLEYKPGQFLTVIVEINGKEERRSYSLCTSPFVDPFPGITVKRLQCGVVSNYLNDHIAPGKKISVMRPMGNFTSEYHSKNARKYGMVAAGSGITPLMGIMKSILVNEPESSVHLLYGSRGEDHIIFRLHLENLKQEYHGRLEVTHYLSRPSESWSGKRGRIVAETLQEFANTLKDYGQTPPQFFLCGPTELMDLTTETLTSMGFDRNSIFFENFYKQPSEEINTSADGEPVIARTVTVVVNGETHTFEVEPGKTILEAGLEENVDMPYSCQSGLCTACRGRLLSGEVSMIEDAGLSENEIAQGYILCCSSKPKGGDIKIVIE